MINVVKLVTFIGVGTFTDKIMIMTAVQRLRA